MLFVHVFPYVSSMLRSGSSVSPPCIPLPYFKLFLQPEGLPFLLQVQMLLDNGWNTRTPERHLAIDQQMRPFSLQSSRRGVFETMRSTTSRPLPLLSFIPTFLLFWTLGMFLNVLSSPILSNFIRKNNPTISLNIIKHHVYLCLILSFFFIHSSHAVGDSTLLSTPTISYAITQSCTTLLGVLTFVIRLGFILGLPLQRKNSNRITDDVVAHTEVAVPCFTSNQMAQEEGLVVVEKGRERECGRENSLSLFLLPRCDVGCAARIP